MKLWVSIDGDGPCWPDVPGGGIGAVDADHVGLAGLTSALEIRLGLAGPKIEPALRIAAWAAKMRASLNTQPETFFARSFAVDPWAAAARVLSMRDALVTDGWTGRAVGLPRIDALAAVEAVGAPLPLGLPDRLAALRAALDDVAHLPDLELVLTEPINLQPPAWNALIDQLHARGAAVSPAPPQPGASHGDLAAAQALLRGEVANACAGDGSLILLDADTSLAAAEAVAEWLAAQTPEVQAGAVVLAPSGDTRLLDGALIRAGLPALGLSPGSAARGALQLLPLAFATTWHPIDPQALHDLLSLPQPPLPRWAAKCLARALSRQPGTSGPVWATAWRDIERIAAERDQYPAVWRAWTDPERFDRAEGMPLPAALTICERVASWADARTAIADDAILPVLARAARTVAGALAQLGEPMLSPDLLNRVVVQALGDGAPDPAREAQAGPLRAVSRPGAIFAAAPTLIWWGFVQSPTGALSQTWSATERAALTASGVLIDPPERAAAQRDAAAARVAYMAGERLILVAPARMDGEPTVAHPLAHRLGPLLSAAVRVRAERVLDHDDAPLFPVEGRTSAAPHPLPAKTPQWTLPAVAKQRLANRTESPTGLIRLTDCPLQWLLADVLRIGGGDQPTPSAARQEGELIHALAAQVFVPGAPPTGAEVQSRLDASMNACIATHAGALAAPEHAAQRDRLFNRAASGFALLALAIETGGYSIRATEEMLEKTFQDNLSMRGRADLVLDHPEHGPAVVDFKWTRGATRYEDELKEGRALQLAAYGAMAGEHRFATGAWCLPAQTRLLGEAGAGFATETPPAKRSIAETWDLLFDTWRSVLHTMGAGDVFATGLGPEDAPEQAVEGAKVPCTYCDYRTLCRVTDEETA